MPKSTTPRRRRSAQEVREKLLAAAVAELDDAGPDRASLRAIARRVGITHQSVAHHFADRRALFTAVAVRGFDDLYAESVAALDELPDAIALGESVATLGQVFVRFARANRSKIALMFGSRLVDNDDPGLSEARARSWNQHAGTVAADVENGWGGTVPAESIAVATFAMAHGMATLDADLPDVFSAEMQFEELIHLVNAAIVTPPRS
ncbi:TetR/AcrR family transcriptional regulator [Gordonia sp. CPCC 205333]|uniref:TetR/AcrR family transcriptional regulator n=1 Tax=Gordonia sp. CPCC 205333 TaxID=3140790 RepID=UPI003AF3A3DA